MTPPVLSHTLIVAWLATSASAFLGVLHEQRYIQRTAVGQQQQPTTTRTRMEKKTTRRRSSMQDDDDDDDDNSANSPPALSTRRRMLSSMATVAGLTLTTGRDEQGGGLVFAPSPPSAVAAGEDALTGAGAERFAKAMSSEGAKVYERRIADQKRELFNALDSSCANVLEIGIGSGPNLGYYGSSVKKLTGVDPNPFMLDKVATAQTGEDAFPAPPQQQQEQQQQQQQQRRRKTAGGVEPTLVRGFGENLPFADGSFDAVVSTLVLCSVEDPEQVLREIARVLKPGGRYLFMEHVRGSGSLALAQDAADPMQVKMAAGCHLNRRTGEFILGAPAFASVAPVQEFSAMGDRGEQFLISPHIMGVAWKAAAAA